MWPILNRACTVTVDLLLWPVASLAPAWQAIWLAIPAALLALVVFRYASDQAGIQRAKDRIQAHLFELWIYRDDFRVSLAAQGQILRHNLAYLSRLALPMAVMIIPFVLLIVQLEAHFAFRALAPRERALLAVELETSEPVSRMPVELELPEGLTAETPALRIDASREIVWRLRADSGGDHELEIRSGEHGARKRVRVSEKERAEGVAIHQYRASDWSTLLYPGEPALGDDGPFARLSLAYPRARGAWLGLSSASWIFFAASLVFGFALRRPLGVTF